VPAENLLLPDYCQPRYRITKRHSSLSHPVQIGNTFVPGTQDIKYLGLLLNPKLLYTKHPCTVTNKATCALCNIFLLLTRDSTLSQMSKLTLYTHSIPSYLYLSCLEYCMWFKLPQTPSCPKEELRSDQWLSQGTPTSHLHDTLSSEPNRDFIHQLTAKFFDNCLSHSYPWPDKLEITPQMTWTLYTKLTNINDQNIHCCNHLTIRHSVF
jgi:hypothetical protein